MMKKTKKRLTRLLAICVCLIVVLSACASAPSGESTVSVTTEESKETSALELSEVNAESTSSEAEPSAPEGHISADSDATLSGDITITPVEPTYPEERETTLEKVMSFDIGIDGVVQYNFTFYDDPSGATMTNIGRIFTDGNGIFYYKWASDLVRLNDGVWFRTGEGYHIDDMAIAGEDLYVLFDDGVVKQYGISAGFASPVLTNTYRTLENGKESLSLNLIGNSELIVRTDQTHQVYTLSGKRLDGKDAPFIVRDDVPYVTVKNDILSIPSAENGGYYVSALDENGVWLQSSLWGDIAYSRFDRDGNLIARVLVGREDFDGKVRIDLKFEHDGEIYTKEYYNPDQVTIGNAVFDELFEPQVFFDSYGMMYFAAYYTDHCDIYRVDAGYTSAEFDTFEPKDEQDSIAPTSSTSETEVSYIIWSGISRSEVETNANKMLELDWTIKRGNLDDRDKSTVSLPHYLRGRQIGEKLEDEWGGIPYCKGGYNGIGGTRDFKTVAGTVIDVDGCPTTGNVAKVGSNQTGTIGLDCARFVCKALDYHSTNQEYEKLGLSPEQFISEYAGIGHWYKDWTNTNIDSVVLMPWDVIVNRDHAMFFASESGSEFRVYDTSSSSDSGRTMERTFASSRDFFDDDPNNVYYVAHLYTEYDSNSSYHWTQCASCGGFDSESEPHTFGNYVSTNSSSHVRTCTVCGYEDYRAHTLSYVTNAMTHRQTCSVCGYLSPTELHNFQYMYDTTKHWRKCRLCDYTTTKTLHTFDADGDCTVCPYSKGLIIMKDPDLPQDVPEVPTDDFIVLCVEPKEEFWELVQR